LHKLSQKADLFNGFAKTYRKLNEEGEEYPQERKKVTHTAINQITELSRVLTEMFDTTASKDYANCKAIADVVVDGKVIAKDVPATFLLFLEKQINDIRTFAEALPVLDESEDWTYDVNSGQYKTEATVTHKSKKVQKPIVLSEATKEHPAQTQLISEDVLVGYWDTVKYSGSLPIPVKAGILSRIDTLSSAVKCAREKANNVNAEDILIGNNIFDYIFVSQVKS
jgi:hypothetical protein